MKTKKIKSVCPGCFYRYLCEWHAREDERHPITECKFLKPYDWRDEEREKEYKRTQKELYKNL